jgi:membrane protein
MGKPGIGKLLFVAYKEFVRDRADGLSAALAYYELLCVGPLVAFVIFFYGKIFGMKMLQNEVIPLLKSSFTPQLTKVIIFMISTDNGIDVQNLTALSLVSGLLLIWASQNYFDQVQDIVETSWNERREKYGIIEKIKRVVKALKITIVTVAIFLVFMGIRSLLPHRYIQAEGIVEDANLFLVKLGQWLTTFLLALCIRVFYFTYIPPVKVYWRNTIPGAILSGLLFIVGREIMMSHFDNRPDADIAESIVMVLLWFYYSGLTLVYSAEFTKLYVSHKQNINYKSLKFDE